VKTTIHILDDDAREVTFEDGVTVTVRRGWSRRGGHGWVGPNCTMTHRSIRDAARSERAARPSGAARSLHAVT